MRLLRSAFITLEPAEGGKSGGTAAPAAPVADATPKPSGGNTPVYSPFEGKVEVVEVLVKAGDAVAEGQPVAAVEAMKARHDVRAPAAGTVREVHVRPGDEVSAGQPIVTLG